MSRRRNPPHAAHASPAEGAALFRPTRAARPCVGAARYTAGNAMRIEIPLLSAVLAWVSAAPALAGNGWSDAARPAAGPPRVIRILRRRVPRRGCGAAAGG